MAERAPNEPIAPGISSASRPADSRVSDSYRFVRRVEVRFRDIDVLGHVNHVVYLSFVEQVRTEYFYEILGIRVPSGNPTAFVIATVNCEYLQPLGWGEQVDVGWRFTRLGRSSADYIFELTRGQEVVARGNGVMVNADPVAGRSAPIPDAWREALSRFEGIAP
ncbi:MAG: acyl-CoA thioesterase [Chloroflexota bacterium]